VGETLAEREAERTLEVVERQVTGGLKGFSAAEVATFVLAYEPVWAIGTGETPTVDEVSAMHGALRAGLKDAAGSSDTPILYGGSVKPANAAELLHADGVDGALVGGASLKAADFLAIIRAAG
jgi:triosephosphate isomerase (TIM)